jgi:hypothetical protein
VFETGLERHACMFLVSQDVAYSIDIVFVVHSSPKSSVTVTVK